MGRSITIKRAACIAYLLIFALSELYSAAATSLDRRSDYPAWEPTVGRWLFAAPSLLILGIFCLVSSRHRKAGFWTAIASLGLYAAFFVFEQAEYRGSATIPVISFINALWLGLFSLTVLAALLLRKSGGQQLSN